MTTRTITIDLDTGAWVALGVGDVSFTMAEAATARIGLLHDDALRVASSVLPGMPADQIDRAYTEWMTDDIDPRPFLVGSRVEVVDGDRAGYVTKRVEAGDGELHTIWVHLDGNTTAHPYSPRQLKAVEA